MTAMGRPAHHSTVAIPISWRWSPSDVIARWPVDRRLFALASGAEGLGQRRARWSILTEPSPRAVILTDADGAGEFDGALGSTRVASHALLPFVGGWIGWFGYELGAAFEPAVGPTPARHALAHLAHCPAALLFDHAAREWWAAGEPSAAAALVSMIERAGDPAPNLPAHQWSAGPLRSVEGAACYQRAVARAIDLIHAGDVFQVNLAHHMRARFEGSSRALFLRLLGEASPDHGALLEMGRDPSGDEPAVVVSVSPELFLHADLSAAGERRIVTRPIKGTRPASAGAGADLRASAKDLAELVMIVDLMRNDLGRVCEIGSVRVDAPRDIESHAGGTLVHAAATVSGRLRPDAAASTILRAAFPPGSVTGAPKVRAMQIIRDLEPSPRGVYCGALGYFSDHGPAMLSVAIRTASLFADAPSNDWSRISGSLDFPVGAGIVADSEPASEWTETLAKAKAFADALGAESRRAEAAIS